MKEKQQNDDKKSTQVKSSRRRKRLNISIMPKGKLWSDKRKPEESFSTKQDGRKWTFLETAKDSDELNNIRRNKFHCRCPSARMATTCRITMDCMYSVRDGCAFMLVVQKTDRGRFHIYGSDEHTCSYKNWQNEMEKQQNITKPPTTLTRIVRGVKWQYDYLKTLNSLEELDDFRTEHQCTNVQRNSNFKMARMQCMKNIKGYCPFALLAWRPTPESAVIHVYSEHNKQHNHLIRPAEQCRNNAAAEPPTIFTKVYNNVEYHYNYMKTVHSMQELDDFRFEHQCLFSSAGWQWPKFNNFQMRCQNSNKERGGCPFALLAWRPKSENNDLIHMYARGEHNHVQKTIEKRGMNRISKYTQWLDKHPPTNFRTTNGREWTFLKTVNIGKHFLSKLNYFKQKYHCLLRQSKQKFSIERAVCRVTLFCSAAPTTKCRFALLAQKTDCTGRYHLYASENHTCMHRKKEVEHEAEYDDEEEEEIEEKEGQEMKEQEYNEYEEKELKEEQMDQIEELDHEVEEEDVYEEKDDEEREEYEDLQNTYGDDAEDDEEEFLPDANVVQQATSLIPPREAHLACEEGAVEFFDFVDHPKCGVKMHRLGEPKKEPGTGVMMITLDEEEQATVNWKIKVPKREVVKEEAHEEDQPGPSNRGEQGRLQQHTNIATAASPMALINRQNEQQQQVMARERWWTKPAITHTAAAPNNEKRLLRERKGRINYRE